MKIPAPVKRDVPKRIRAAAAAKLPPGLYTRLDIHFKAQFCYIDAFQEPPTPTADWPPKDWPEPRDAYLERLRNTPIPLCRLRYFGGDRWGFAMYVFSQEKYELSVFPNGEFFGRPEEAFLLAASFYLDSEAPYDPGQVDVCAGGHAARSAVPSLNAAGALVLRYVGILGC